MNKYYNIPVIDNPKYIMKVLVNLANNEKNEYELKRFLGSCFEEKYRKKNIKNNNMLANIWVIAKKDILDTIDSKKIYFRDEFGSVVDDILLKGSSAIYMTENGDGIIIEPQNILNKNILAFDAITDGNNSNIVFCLYNDKLKEATDILIDHLIDNISENKAKKI